MLVMNIMIVCNPCNNYLYYAAILAIITCMQTQDALNEYCAMVRDIYSDDFWLVFAGVCEERAVLIDRVLKTTRDVYVREAELKKKFATSVREIRDATREHAGDFAAHVMHEVTIDTHI